MSNQELINIFKRYCIKTSEMSFFINIKKSKEYSNTEVVGLYDSLLNYFKDVDFRRFNEEELVQLGFSYWDEELLLASPLLLSLIKDGTVLTTINGDKETVGVDKMSFDSRFGASAYGFTIPELRDYKIGKVIE